jgi:hypothetical protein
MPLRTTCSFAVPALLCAAMCASAQSPVRCTGPGYDDLDFWVGNWTVRWTDSAGKEQHGTNSIRRTLDGCVVLEEFNGAPGSPLKGTSVSVYDARLKVWKQTWVDNNASYLDFVGSRDDDRFVLARNTERDGRPLQQRMVFRDIAADRLVWDWQRSLDGGATWQTTWSLRYARQ